MCQKHWENGSFVNGFVPAPATWSSDKKSPTGAKSGDRGVFSFAGREIEPLIPRYSKGLRRSRAVSSLGGDVARDSTDSHAWALLDPLLPQTLDRLSVSRGLDDDEDDGTSGGSRRSRVVLHLSSVDARLHVCRR